jgi:hypothetical protein
LPGANHHHQHPDAIFPQSRRFGNSPEISDYNISYLTFNISIDKFITLFVIINEMPVSAQRCAATIQQENRQRRLIPRGTDVFLRLWPLKR